MKRMKVKRVTFHCQLTWPSTMKSDGSEEFAATGSVDGIRVNPETHFIAARMYVDTTLALAIGDSFLPLGAAGERPDSLHHSAVHGYNSQSSLRLAIEICLSGEYLRKAEGV